jgi:hypothetical protein
VVSEGSEKRVRSLLGELRGYLETAPDSVAISGWELAKSLEAVLGELTTATGADYARFRVERQRSEFGGPYINGAEYRSKLSGLVSRLEQEYGLQATPASSRETVTLNLNQTLSQLTHVSLNIELRQVIEERLHQYAEGSKERNFFERLSASLGAVKDVAGLIALVGTTAEAVGLGVQDIAKLFSAH